MKTGSETEVGIFRRASYGIDGTRLGCVSYEETDSMLQTARLFGTLTPMLTGGSLLLVGASLCFRPKSSSLLWKMAFGLTFFAILSQMLTFLALGMEMCTLNDCRLTGVGALGVFSILVLLVLSTLLYIEPTPTQPWLLVWSDRYLEPESLSEASDNQERTLDGGFEDDNTIPAEVKRRRTHFAPEIEIVEETERHSEEETSFAVSTRGGGAYSCSVPRFVFRLIYVGLVLVSWSMSLFSIQRCTFLLVGLKSTSRNLHSGLGLFSRAIYENNDLIGCVTYTDDLRGSFDSPFLAGRAFGVLTSLFLTLGAILTVIQLFVGSWRSEIWLSMKGILLAACVAQILVFVVFGTGVCNVNDQTQCVVGSASLFAIFNLLLLLALCTATFCLEAPTHPIFLIYNETNRSRLQSLSASALERKLSSLPDGSVEDEDHNTNASSSEEDHHHQSVQRYLERSSPAPQYERAPDDAQEITVRVEFSPTERRTVKEITHPDGSKTVKTTVEELNLDMEYEDSEYEESDYGSDHDQENPARTLPSLLSRPKNHPSDQRNKLADAPRHRSMSTVRESPACRHVETGSLSSHESEGSSAVVGSVQDKIRQFEGVTNDNPMNEIDKYISENS